MALTAEIVDIHTTSGGIYGGTQARHGGKIGCRVAIVFTRSPVVL